MASGKGLADLARRKELLVLRSDLLRSQIALHAATLERPLGWVDTGLSAARALRRSGALLGALGGLLLAWKTFRAPRAGEAPSLILRLITGGFKVAGFVGPLLGVARGFLSREEGPGQTGHQTGPL